MLCVSRLFYFSLVMLKYLHWCSVCGLALKILDEVQSHTYPVDPWKTDVTLEKCTFHGGALEMSIGKYIQFLFIDCLLFLIDHIV